MIPWSSTWKPTPVFLPGESPWTEVPGEPSPWGLKESDTTERLSSPHKMVLWDTSPPSSWSAGFPNKGAIPCPKGCRKQYEFGLLIMTPAELVWWMVGSHSYTETASSYVTIHVRDCEPHNYTILNLISVHHQLNLFLDISHKLLCHSSPT